MKIFKWLALLLVVIGLAFGVARALKQRAVKQEEAARAAQAQMIAPTFELMSSDTYEVAQREIVQSIRVTGSVKATQNATLKAPVAATVETVMVQAGDTVKAGQLLATLDPVDLQQRLELAEQQWRSAQAQAAIAKRQWDSNEALVKQGFISNVAAQASQDSWLAAQAQAKAAQANVRLAQQALKDANICAPFAAQVARTWVRAGDRVGVNAPVIELVDPSALEIEAQASAQQLANIALGQTARLHLDGNAQAVEAKLVRINPSMSSATRSLTLYFSLPDSARTRPGVFAQGTLEINRAQGLAVPSTALRNEKPEPYVQVVASGQIRHVPVEVVADGRIGDDAYAIVSGLQAQDVVLRASAGAIAAGTSVRLIESATPSSATN